MELYVKRAGTEEKYAHFTVRPKVYIIHNNQKGALLCDETKRFRTWITAYGLKCNPHSLNEVFDRDICDDSVFLVSFLFVSIGLLVAFRNFKVLSLDSYQ